MRPEMTSVFISHLWKLFVIDLSVELRKSLVLVRKELVQTPSSNDDMSLIVRGVGDHGGLSKRRANRVDF